jgi:TonB-dependent receptor
MSAETEQDEPDRRLFGNGFSVQPSGDTVFSVDATDYDDPLHIFRNLEESNRSGQFDLLLRFRENQPAAGSFKTGMAFSDKERIFRERRFSFKYARVDGIRSLDDSVFWSTDNLGVVESQSDLDTTQPVVVGATELRLAKMPINNYNADEEIWAWYGMVDLPLFDRVQVIAGARYEHTLMTLALPYMEQEARDTLESSPIDAGEWLPSLNLRYGLTQDMNLRAAVTRTIARPTIRERAPYTTQEFNLGNLYTGNPDLKYSLATNFDLRWEYFTGPGEVLSISGFYKRIKDPIDLAFISSQGEQKPLNVDRGTVVGIEFEWRQGLRRIHSSLSNFALGGNVTLVESRVSIPELELAQLRRVYPDHEDYRPLQGQSPYILNLDLSYRLQRHGLQTSLLYNVFGERFAINGQGLVPDVYEQPRHMLEWTLSKVIFGSATLKLGASNLLNDAYELTQEYQGQVYYYSRYQKGVTWKIGLSTSL